SELLSDDGKNEIGVGLRQVEQLLPAAADALADEAAVAQGEPRLDDLKAAAARVAPRIHERGDPPHAVGRHPHREHDQRQRQRRVPLMAWPIGGTSTSTRSTTATSSAGTTAFSSQR